ncbi:MAG: hypothetical protein SFV81_22690 [Pirellulaceae bacterium]|nr:hypothetical protein [Pirellulaceae bacterium]
MIDLPGWRFGAGIGWLGSGSRQGRVDYWVAEAVKAFESHRSTLEMRDAFRYETLINS